MTVARITEISSISKKSFDDAVAQGVARANKTLKNVKSAWIQDQEVLVVQQDGTVCQHGIAPDLREAQL